MSDYIRREDAKKKHCDVCIDKYICYASGRCTDTDAFDLIQAADVVEVVRCKNCKNADSNGMGCCYVWCNEMQQAVSEDGWCYRGEDMRGKDNV